MSESRLLPVYYDTDDATITYAARELASYLARMTGSRAAAVKSGGLAGKDGIRLGLLEQFSLQPSPVADPFFDDEIYLDLNSGQGIVAGNNPRSVLFAVYRLLEELDCAFLWPGPDGERIPRRQLAGSRIQVRETPSSRHRGIDFGGMKDRADVLGLIRWAPKLGFNSIFFEGIEPWKDGFYVSDRQEDGQRTRLYPAELAQEYYAEAVAEIKKLGLLFHTGGHGFTSAPLGILPSHRGPVSQEIQQRLAVIDGKRQLRGNFADTNLCYSQAGTRELITDYITGLLRSRPEIDVLHVWLADGNNNHCECSSCSKVLPADLYIQALNELAGKLEKENIPTRLVFISYTDLIWRPQTTELKDKDRFILTHAPFYRSYQKALGEAASLPDLPPYTRNQNEYPVPAAENMAFIRSWQDWWGRDSFLFEYHFWRAHYSDPSQLKIARVLHDDLKAQAGTGLAGLVSCQVIRCFWPLGLGMQVLGKTLWSAARPFADLVEQYFASAFGPDGPSCQEFFNQLSQLYGLDPADPLAGREFSWTDSGYEKYAMAQKSQEDFARLIQLVEDFAGFTGQRLKELESEHLPSWRHLALFLEVLGLYLLTWESKIHYGEKRTSLLWRIFASFVREQEEKIGSVFDVASYLSWVRPYFK